MEEIHCYIVAFFQGIPDAVIGTIIGALITLFGVHLSNKGAERRLKTELENTNKQKKKDKEHQFKKDIYSSIVSDIAKFKSYVFNLPQIDTSNSVNNNNDFKSSNIVMVANEETLNMYAELNSYMIEKILYLMLKKAPLDDNKRLISLNDHYIDKYNIEQENELIRMKEYNLQQLVNKPLWDTLQNNFNFNKEQLDNFNKANEELYQTQHILVSEFIYEANEVISQMLPLELKVIKNIRKELNFSDDLDSYEETLKSQHNTNKLLIKNFSEELNEKYLEK